ncbi:hypothetical protein Tco_0366659 [Tanacetum coccineum]
MRHGSVSKTAADVGVGVRMNFQRELNLQKKVAKIIDRTMMHHLRWLHCPYQSIASGSLVTPSGHLYRNKPSRIHHFIEWEKNADFFIKPPKPFKGFFMSMDLIISGRNKNELREAQGKLQYAKCLQYGTDNRVD